MGFLYGLLKFFIAFIAISSLELLIFSTIKSIINPDLKATENGVVEGGRNARVWFGLITAVCWALMFVL